MAASIDSLIKSAAALKFAAFIARITPPRLGYFIAGFAARWIATRRNSEQVKAILSNQWVIAGEATFSQSLDETVQAVFRNSARSIYELYHYIQNPRAIGQLYCIDPSFQAVADRPEFDGCGLVVAGLHMVGFDLGLQWLCMNQFKPLVLTIPNPEGGRRLEFETRQKSGMNLVPGSVQGLRQAIRHLLQGGVVVTGIDRPISKSDPQPRFFGRPAALPSHHIFLALKTHVPVLVIASRLEKDGKYHIYASKSIEMDPYPSRQDELKINAEKVLATAEWYIRQAPSQWIVPLPVWPDITNKITDYYKV